MATIRGSNSNSSGVVTMPTLINSINNEAMAMESIITQGFSNQARTKEGMRSINRDSSVKCLSISVNSSRLNRTPPSTGQGHNNNSSSNLNLVAELT